MSSRLHNRAAGLYIKHATQRRIPGLNNTQTGKTRDEAAYRLGLFVSLTKDPDSLFVRWYRFAQHLLRGEEISESISVRLMASKESK